MGCHSMRVVLGKRLTESVETTAAIRAELMNERKKLRELEEGAREAKKRKREAELIEMQAKAAKMHEEAVEKAKQGDKAEDAKGKGKKLNQALAAAAAKGGGAGDEGADPAPPSKKMKKVKSSASVADLPLASSSDPLVDLEPSFDLPDDLREFKGSPGDKKGLVTFRHRQQKEKARLDKLKAEWDKERKTREREREATRKAEEQEERRREKGMKAAEEAIQGHLEALEAEAERLAIRRPPLGTDRFHRKYWWGLGGYKEGLLIECPQEGLHGHDSSCSAWVRVEDEGKIQAFLDKLDQRVREEAGP